MNDQTLSEIYDFAVQLGKDAGQLLLDAAWSRAPSTTAGGNSSSSSAQPVPVEKESSVDIVTETDHAVEAFIKDSIAAKYPEHEYVRPHVATYRAVVRQDVCLTVCEAISFLGEETYSAGSSKTYLVTSGPTWVVDPLDGTVNFTHLFPMFCVSIAFCVQGQPVIGVINAPLLNQFFSACRGKGSWLNETRRLPLVRDPIPPLPQEAPSGCIFACEWGKDRRDGPAGNLSKKVDSFVVMALERKARDGKGGMVHGIRSLGRSATLDLAYTAMGSFDIWWEGGCWEWDVAAGIAILEEAGGLVTTANPPSDPAASRVPAANLGGRLYLAIRPAGGSEHETGLEAQHRVVRQVWRRVQTLEYERPFGPGSPEENRVSHVMA
ncbi:inositol monophosphatase [Moelleriella libera RCEF 2490]|uniref:Inositol-1-monophosphatase n=1 Tax=Moelleriella libera RCEF 2490 TaxID=1081109 RepID=A0A168ASI8_9HYPO|nr:inositol monophosphatase [Moelleriella libera RCEF 2490]